MDISFVIPALNEERNIGNCISSIREFAPTSRSIEIVVGDHGSTDDTAVIAKKLGAFVVPHPKSTVGAFRNALVAQAKGNVLVFLDADVTLTADWRAAIEGGLEVIDKDERVLLGSRCSPPESDNFFLRNWFRKMSLGPMNYLGTGHMIMRREFFQLLQGFDPSLVSGEDFDICTRAKRAGGRIVENPRLKVIHHDYPETIGAFIRREAWHGTGDFQSWTNFFASRVAIATALFLLLHVVLAAALVSRNGTLAGAAAGSIVGLLTLSSINKFRRLSISERLCSLLIFYLYYLGRTRSLFLALVRPLSRPSRQP